MVETTIPPNLNDEPEDSLTALARRWRSLLTLTLVAGVAGYGGSYLVRPLFTAQTTFLPPQQQSGASAALASLGALASLTGANAKNQTDQYVGLLQSATIADRMIAKFGLKAEYEVDFDEDARRQLAKRTSIVIGKKDGLVSVAVDDTEPIKSAAMANQYVEELRQLTSVLAISEAQQRRLFFEKQLQEIKSKLASAQVALQDSGFTLGALKSEPRSAADSYAKLRAEETASEIRLQTLRGSFAESTPEVQQEVTRLQALREQLREQEKSDQPNSTGSDYVGKYREFKYQETLFELIARQYEVAKVDESREGAIIQVVDPAKRPERKTSPKRGQVAAGCALMASILYGIAIAAIARFRASQMNPSSARRWERLKDALRHG